MGKRGFRWTAAKYDKSFKLQKKNYQFVNYFSSEAQLKNITHESEPEKILTAYNRLIWVYASNHVRDGVEIEDLIAEGQKGVCEAMNEFNDKARPKPNYNFYQACLYKIRSNIFQYCLRNASQIKTPYYVQRGMMHISQIYKLMSNQATAEKILKRPGPATDQEIINFIYNEDERLPKKSMRFIKQQITKKRTKEEFEQILSGVLNHELGSRHSYVKNNLTDVGKILHIKEKLFFTSSSNNMDYRRVIELIMSARQSKVELESIMGKLNVENVEKSIVTKELFAHGAELCGKLDFEIFVQNKLYDKSYDELSRIYNLKKLDIIEIIKKCIRLLRKDTFFQELFNEL